MSGQTLSVVLPNYNHARYLPVSLEAIAAQSFPPKEIIVVDDASTDESVAVIEALARRYPAIRLLRNPKNLGANASARRGLMAATGDYVTVPAADDKILPGLYEKSMELLSRHPQAGLCCALARLIDPDGADAGPYETAVVSEEARFIPPEEYLPAYAKHDNWIITYTVVYRRDAVLEMDGYDPALGPLTDAVLNREIAMKYGACFIPERLACWRRVRGGYTREYGRDTDRVMELFDFVERRTLSGKNGSPPTAAELQFIRLWKQRMVFQMIYQLSQESACPYDRIARVAAHLPSGARLERAFFSMLPALSALGRLPLRALLFAKQAPAERKRILLNKFNGLLRR